MRTASWFRRFHESAAETVLVCMIDAPVFALVGDADPHVTVDEAMLWKGHANGPFELSVFPGGHFFLNQHAPAVMQKIVENIPSPP